jgi:hypothetical protein
MVRPPRPTLIKGGPVNGQEVPRTQPPKGDATHIAHLSGCHRTASAHRLFGLSDIRPLPCGQLTFIPVPPLPPITTTTVTS